MSIDLILESVQVKSNEVTVSCDSVASEGLEVVGEAGAELRRVLGSHDVILS